MIDEKKGYFMKFLFVFLTFLISSGFSVENLPKSSYQDIIIHNKVVKKGYGQDCLSRYESLKPILNQYKRPITVLDLGAAEGYFSHRKVPILFVVSQPRYIPGKDNVQGRVYRLNDICIDGTDKK